MIITIVHVFSCMAACKALICHITYVYFAAENCVSTVVAPRLLFSVVSHYALLPRRSCWSPNADCYPTAPSLLCGWSDGLEWSPGCVASDASSPTGTFPL